MVVEVDLQVTILIDVRDCPFCPSLELFFVLHVIGGEVVEHRLSHAKRHDPFEFQVDRNESKQIAFGFGAHVCLGQHLARMEMSSLFRKLLARVDHLELAGEPKYTQATFVGGLKSLPIRYRMK